MPPPRKVGDRRAANWNLSSKNSRKIIVLIGDLALTNMGLGDKAAAFALAERAMAANPIEKDALTGGPIRSRSSPEWRREWESPTAPSPLYRNYSRYRTRAHWLRACRSLLRCSGSIQCSIRFGMIRASKKLFPHLRQNELLCNMNCA